VSFKVLNFSGSDRQHDEELLQIENLKVEFKSRNGSTAAVKNVSFDIKRGETVCVVGESGSGKSVTSLSLMRLIEFGGGTVSEGKMLFRLKDGGMTDLSSLSTDRMRQIRGNEIGMIFQEPMTSLNPIFTIERQLSEGLRVHEKLSRNAAQARVLELLRQVRIPEPERRLKQYPHELSGGMRQRVVIAMALACRPRLLIADEPTTALDVTTQAEILALINSLKSDYGTAVMFITHDMAVVAQIADRVIVMYKGEVVETGTVEEIFNNPREEYTRNLLASVPKLGDMAGTTFPATLPVFGFHKHEARVLDLQASPNPSPIVEVRNLVTRFPVKSGLFRKVVANVHAVEDVSFTINKGETLALVGESGCGKSTTGRSILRLVDPRSGKVLFGDVDLCSLNNAGMHEHRRKLQMIFQDPFSSLNPQRRLFDQVAEPLQNYEHLTQSELEDRIALLFERVELPRSFLRRYPHELSGGQRQRVAIARALALNPSLIIADEAVSALDVSVQAQVLNLMLELQADLKISYLFISHDMAIVERVSHQVGVMYLGRIVEIGPRAAIFENPQHEYTRSLLSAVPIADPSKRNIKENISFKPISSPVFPVGYQPRPSVYESVSPGHLVLRDQT
jgi:peptide/nickel transport system ATP-binding protein/glutathione transport system ATP-binding protein